MDPKGEKGLNPYLAGGLTGLLMILSAWIAGHLFGASTTFARAAGMIEKMIIPEHVAALDYFAKYGPTVDWQFMFVVGILLGSFIAAASTRTFRWQAVPDMWYTRFGSGRGKRASAAFIGGIVAIYGARLAGG